MHRRLTMNPQARRRPWTHSESVTTTTATATAELLDTLIMNWHSITDWRTQYERGAPRMVSKTTSRQIKDSLVRCSLQALESYVLR